MGTITSVLAMEIFSQTTTTSGTGQSGSSGSNPFDQLLQQLGSDLNNNNLSAAQTDFSQLEQAIQGNSGTNSSTDSTSSNCSTSGHHHHHGSGSIDQLLQQIDNMLNTIQSDLTGSSTTGTTTTSITTGSGISITA